MATAQSYEDKEFWRQFIALYHDLPELWKVKSEEYKNRNKKDAAYDKMVTKMKEINPKADRAAVRAKINALRTSYRRELKKIKDSIASGRETDDVYVPNLWYFHNIDFLRDQETQMPGTSTMDYTENEEKDETYDMINESEHQYTVRADCIYNDNTTKHSKTSHEKETKKRAIETEPDYNHTFKKASYTMNKPVDEFQIFGDYVASELRSLRSPENQRKLKLDIQRAIIYASEIDLSIHQSNSSFSQPISPKSSPDDSHL